MTLNVPLLRAIQRRILETPEKLNMHSMQTCINRAAADELGISWMDFATIRDTLGCAAPLLADELFMIGGATPGASAMHIANGRRRQELQRLFGAGTIPYAVAVIQHIDAFIAKHNKVATEVRELEEVMVTPVGDVITQIAEEVMA